MTISRDEAMLNPVLAKAIRESDAKQDARNAKKVRDAMAVKRESEEAALKYMTDVVSGKITKIPLAPEVRFFVDGNPMGTNGLYASIFRKGKMIRVPTKRGVEWKKSVRAWALLAIPSPHKQPAFPEGGVCVQLSVNLKDKRRRDVDGFAKPILDALTGLVYEDDSQVTYLVVSKQIGTPVGVEVRAWRAGE